MLESDIERNTRIASAGLDLVIKMDELRNKHSLSHTELMYLMTDYVRDDMKKAAYRRRKRVNDG